MKLRLVKTATKLRKDGFSFREISEKLNISKSTASLWLSDVELPEKAKKRIYKLGIAGRKNAADSVKVRIANENKEILRKVKKTLSNSFLLKNNLKVVCALLYWCEGGKKEKSKVSFINSDPELVRYFVGTFRKAFDADNEKFRALIHIHNYHNVDRQTEFWSKVTGIPKNKFTKPYHKPNTGKRKKR